MSLKIRAIGSGFFGAGASCFAKLALDPNSQVSTWARDQCFELQESYFQNNFCGYTGVLSRGVFLLGMIAMNLAMVATFFEGMIESGSTIATALATGSNFTLSVSFTTWHFAKIHCSHEQLDMNILPCAA